MLITVGAEFLLIGGQRVQMCIESSLYLELIVDEEIHVLRNTLLIDYTIGVILIVVVLKLRARHVLAVDAHDNGVLPNLRKRGRRYKIKDKR